jgi:aspartate aminotransferase
MLTAFTERRKVIVEGINAIPQLSCPTPMGAFYVFVDVSQTGLDSLTFSDKLLESLEVAVIPGIAFGDDQCIRLSYATDMATIEKGLDRLAKFVSRL